jgi:FlaA1/EpsC-like NDP-sugar epimerase
MGEPVKILDLAKDMIRFSGYEPDKDIAIIFIGKRPGEKLFEEILSSEEGATATKNQRIFVARQSSFDAQKISEEISEMLRFIKEGNNETAVKILKNLIIKQK